MINRVNDKNFHRLHIYKNMTGPVLYIFNGVTGWNLPAGRQVEPPILRFLEWCHRVELNHRPQAYESCALTI